MAYDVMTHGELRERYRDLYRQRRKFWRDHTGLYLRYISQYHAHYRHTHWRFIYSRKPDRTYR